jgi:excisionase family DNA binding protein
VSERLLDARAIAERLGIPEWGVLELAHSGAMPCVRLGRYVRFDLATVEAWYEAEQARPTSDYQYDYARAWHELHCELGGCRHASHYDDGEFDDGILEPLEGWCALCRYVAVGLEGGRGRASVGLGAWELSLDEMAKLDRSMDARYGRAWRRSGIGAVRPGEGGP